MRGVKMRSKKIIMFLVATIFLLIVIIVLMITGVIDKNENCNNEMVMPKSSVDKSQIIEYYKKMVTDYANESHEYSVVDINDDNIPELFIYTTGVIDNSIIANTNVYTYDEAFGNEVDNYVVFIGTLNGRIDNDTIFYKMNDGKLLSVIGKMGYEITSSYSLDNDWLVRTNYSSKYTDEYTIGDKEIIFKPCTDTSLLDEYK